MIRTPRPSPVLALAVAAGLLLGVGCLHDIEPPDPAVGHVHHDWDGDGYCEENPCEPGAEPGDCDDEDPDIHPGADEACDGIDTDCDGEVPGDETDVDGDGYLGCEDCDDGDESIHPGAEEVCDGADTDCDGSLSPAEIDDDGDGVDECGGDCDDGNADSHPGATELCDGLDNDCDGDVPANEVDEDGDGFRLCDDDCDDGNAEVYPGAPEACDGLDSDCDGQIPYDEKDQDGDGQMICLGDCDDTDPTTYAGAPELCDEVDNDCDGTVDDDVTPLQWYPDNDGDGYGDPDGPVIADCAQPSGHVLDDQDCDDTSAEINPGEFEAQCDGVDTNCDGTLHPDEVDDDGDGLSECQNDCDDGDDTNFPGNTEVCDGHDNDCDNATLPDEVDADGDGWLVCAGDCDDTDTAVHPGAAEVCDGVIDNNCDGVLDPDDADEDQDGWAVCDGDCLDADAATYPGATELCDGLDNDCDGTLPNDEVDADYDGSRICDADCDDGNPALNQMDWDGDGVTTCDGPPDCDDYDPWSYPGAPEECDGADNDCDGTLPNDEQDADGDGYPACAECNDADATIYPGAPEQCDDGIDQDCDGVDDACNTCEVMEFDGTDDGLHVTGAPGFDGLGELTAELWLRPSGVMNQINDAAVLLDVQDGLGHPLWRLAYGTLEPGALSFEVQTTAADLVAAADVELAAGIWTHLAATYDGTTARLYVDGELLGWDEHGQLQAPLEAGAPHGLTVATVDGGGHELVGKVDSIRVSDAVRYQPSDVPFYPDLAHQPDGDTLLLLALDEGSGTPADSAPVPHTVQKLGSPGWVTFCVTEVLDEWAGVGLGKQHSCGLRPRGTVQCWGADAGGQADAPLGPHVAVDGGFEHTCAITLYGELVCWGCANADVGQCDPQAPQNDAYQALAVGGQFGCALRDDGAVHCWGLNDSNQTITPGTPLVQIAAGWTHACGLDGQGLLACWGDNAYSQQPPVASLVPYDDVDAGAYHTCAVRSSDGAVECWGAGATVADCVSDHDCGQAAPPLGAFEQVSCGTHHSCALDAAGAVTCWGDDSWGQVSGAPNEALAAIASGDRHSCGVTQGGAMVCWGADDFGQVGDIP